LGSYLLVDIKEIILNEESKIMSNTSAGLTLETL